MSDQTRYSDYVMSSNSDDFFLLHTNEQMPTWADGEVEAPTGWFAVIRVEREDVLAFNQEAHDPWVTMERNLRTGAWYVVQIDNLGFVWTVSYEGLDGGRPEADQRRRALADFNRLQRQYIAWLDEPAFGHKLCDGLPLGQTTCPDHAAHM